MAKYTTEFVGTFFLVLTICLASSSGAMLTPLAVGAILMAMVYMGGHISGGHYNPAVSLAVCIRGKITSMQWATYTAAQIAGAFAAALIAAGVMDISFAPAPDEGASVGGAVAVEILYTFALALVVLHVATSKATAGNSYYGLAIGFTVAAAAIAGGSRSGGAFNPAVGLAPTVVASVLNDGPLENLWIHIVCPLIGGALAAMFYRVQAPGE